MVIIKEKNILIDGKPVIILCGEIHYFRLKKVDWQKAIDELKNAGCNAVASYIPWICHEWEEGKFDLTGIYREEHDIAGFIELCERNNLYFLPRPGPFIMAEMKNEGIPHWVFKKYPDVYPVTWDNKPVSNITCDYLNPDYLCAVNNWYNQIMTLIAKHLPQNGGKVICVQLDNEIGMLSWVSNCPDLTDFNLDMFIDWFNKKYNSEPQYGFILNKDDKTRNILRSPTEEFSLKYHKDLGHFMRHRFTLYIAELKAMAEKNGVTGIPFLVNVHGSGGYRGTGYPIGLSQLYETYKNCDDIISGSDFYIGDVDIGNFQDVYLANIFTDCMNSKDQPLTSMEFEAGDGNYGDNFDSRTGPSAVDIKTRMFIAQGNRLLNYYLFSGGENYRVDENLNDGNDRIAFTGQKHGFAAPIDPYMKRNTTYDKTADVVTLMAANSPYLSTMSEESDNLVMGFIPDYYMTEYHYPKSVSEQNMIEEIKSVRDRGYYSTIAKSLLLLNYRFKAVDIQNNNISNAIPDKTALIIPSCLYMSEEIQQNIINYIKNGGNIFIYGKLPIYDMVGNSCTLLADLLGAKHKEVLINKHRYFTSVYPCGFAAQYPETRCYSGQTVNLDDGEVFMRLYGTDDVCGFTKKVGSSTVVCLLNEYHCQLPLMNKLFEMVGINRKISNDCCIHGVFITTTKNNDQRYVHIMNMDGYQKDFYIYENGEKLFSFKIHLEGKQCLMLPINLKLSDRVEIIQSTAEFFGYSKGILKLRLTQPNDIIILKGMPTINVKCNHEIILQDNDKTVIKTSRLLTDNEMIEIKVLV